MGKKALLLAAAIAATGPACADWEKSARHEQQTWYIDYSTLRVSGGTRRVWTMVSGGDRLGNLSTKTFDEYDCKEGRFRTLSMIAFTGEMGEGRASIIEGPPSWHYIAPESVGDSLMKAVCNRR